MARDEELTPPHESVRSLIEHRAAESDDATYLISARDGRRVTYDELLARVRAFHDMMRTFDIAVGARVGLMIADPLDFAVALLAVLGEGSWAAPLDPTIDVTNAELLARRTTDLRLDIVIADRPSPRADLRWVTMSFDLNSSRADASHTSPASSGGIILSSSGTTGTPKVIALSEGQLVHTATLIARNNRLTSDDRGFNPLPLWHINAEVVGVLASLVAGASLVLDDRFHRSDFWHVIDQFHVTWINAVPAIISRIAVVREGEAVPQGLRFVRSASAPLAPALLTSFETNTGVAVMESYGMTEAASQICVNPLDGPRKIGSVGPPVGVELRITPFTEEPDAGVADHSATNSVGHVEIRGPSVIRHYDAQGYEERFDADGWLKTGDLGYLDDDGYLFLVGRSDDVINRGGEKIFPREIEDVVLATSDVVAAVVVGVPDEVFGQVPVLYVQFSPADRESRTLDDRVGELNATLSASFARARRPVRVVVVDSFPTHATGKILKKALVFQADAVLLERDLV